MKIVYAPIDLKRTVAFHHVIQYNLETSILETTVALSGNRASYPTMTAHLRALALLAKRMDAVITGAGSNMADTNKLMASIASTGQGFAAIAEGFTMSSIQQRTKLLEGWIVKDAAAEAVTQTVRSVDENFIADRELYELVFYAVPGTGPLLSEDSVLITAANLVRIADSIAKYREPGPAAAQVKLAMINILAWLRHSLAEKVGNPQVLLTGKTEDMLNARVNTLRELSGYITGALVSATHQVTKHYLRWMNDPWVKTSVYGRSADDLSRMITTFEERMPPIGPFTPLASLADSSLFDADVIELPTVARMLAEPPMTRLPIMADAYQQPLAGDLRYPISVAGEAVTTWLNAAWTLVQFAQEVATSYMRSGYESLSTINVPDRKPELRGEGGVAGLSVANGYPLVVPSDPTVYWPVGRWALRALDTDPLTLTTRQQLIARIQLSYPQIPIRIVGPQRATPLVPLPIIRPVFEILDDDLTYLPKDVESLATLWGTTVERFRRYIASLGLVTNQLPWRQLAEALRFIGLLRIDGNIVEPFSRHWYHATRFDKSTLGNVMELLPSSQAPNAAGVSAQGVTFHPFTHVPKSADIALMPTTMMQVRSEQDNANLPLLQWIAPETNPATASGVVIRGWTIEDNLLDLVLIDTVGVGRDYYLTSMSDSGPLAGRAYNAVLAVAEPATPASPPTANVPVGMFEFLTN